METVDNKNAFCPKCGAELEADAIFCSECGAQLTKQEEAPQNEASKEEQKPQESPQSEASPAKTAASAPRSVQEEKTPAPAALVASPSPPPAQKFCLHCGTPLPMDAMFCQKCGTRQDTQHQPQPASASTVQPQGAAAAQPNQPTASSNINIDMEAFKAGVNKGGIHHVLLAAAVVIAVSVFLPLVNIAGMASLKLMDVSSALSVLVLLVAVGTAYASMLGKYDIPVVMGHGFLFMLLYGVFKYQSKLSEMEANFWTALAKNAFRADWGFYLMPIAVLGLIFGGLMAGIQQTGKVPELPSLIERWKQVMLQPVKIHTISFQGIAWSIAIAIVMIFVAMQSSGAKQLGL